jgi:uridylate kinase
MIVAIKIGGSVFCPGEEPDAGFVRELASTLLLLSSNHRIIVVVGGGRLARKLIIDARKRGKPSAYGHVPVDVDEVRRAFGQSRIVVVGGFRPGQTTDAVTVQSALAVGADMVVIGTDVKGVYDKDPKRHEDARFIREMTSQELVRIVGSGSVEPGKNTVVDRVAAELIMKSGKKAVVLGIRDLKNLVKAIDGGDFEGTIVKGG